MDIVEKVYDFYKKCGLKKGCIGKTEGGRKIPYIFLGVNKKPVIISQYAIHAREHITSLLCLKQIEFLINRNIDFGIYFIPMSNPDGIDIALNNLKNVSENRKKFLLSVNGNEDFSDFKANLNCVDLNVNFDADFGTGVRNVNYLCPENYIGEKPFCEKETKALRAFTRKIKPDITLSWHTKGEEIYWYFGQEGKEKERDYILARSISESNSYPLKYSFGSAGGYKDWCIRKLNIPSYTVEVGNDNLSHPLGENQLEPIFEKNKYVFEDLAKTYRLISETE